MMANEQLEPLSKEYRVDSVGLHRYIFTCLINGCLVSLKTKTAFDNHRHRVHQLGPIPARKPGPPPRENHRQRSPGHYKKVASKRSGDYEYRCRKQEYMARLRALERAKLEYAQLEAATETEEAFVTRVVDAAMRRWRENGHRREAETRARIAIRKREVEMLSNAAAAAAAQGVYFDAAEPEKAGEDEQIADDNNNVGNRKEEAPASMDIVMVRVHVKQ